MNIGVFDSGLGGLTILKAITETLPQYNYIYYGDTASLPLGDKDEKEIYELTKHGVEELFRRDCLIVIVACNTASAESVRKLQDTFLKENYPERKVLGVIVPTIETLIDSGVTSALLLATKRTVDSNKYPQVIKDKGLNINISSKALPELVPLIETGETAQAAKIAKSTISEYEDVDAVILGCTHYTKLKKELRSSLNKLQVISQDEIIPHKLADYLDRHKEIQSKLSQDRTRDIVLTKHRADYDEAIKQLLT